VLGRQNACEKMAAFLLDLAERQEADRFIALPMQRNDIADYLGLTFETVSGFSASSGLRPSACPVQTGRSAKLRGAQIALRIGRRVPEDAGPETSATARTHLDTLSGPAAHGRVSISRPALPQRHSANNFGVCGHRRPRGVGKTDHQIQGSRPLQGLWRLYQARRGTTSLPATEPGMAQGG
jgi:hypothetical protein